MERYTEDALMSDMILCLRELDSRAQPNTCRVLAKLATDYTKQLADAQATVEALQRELLEWKRALCGLTPGGSEFADDHAYCAEWVRKARENQHDIIISKHRELKATQATQAALDAEREKVKGLEGQYQRAYGRAANAEQAVTDLRTQLTQLQALVRGFIEAWDHDGEPNAVAYEGVVERARATLDATMPATMGSNILEEDIGKAMMRSKGGDDE